MGPFHGVGACTAGASAYPPQVKRPPPEPHELPEEEEDDVSYAPEDRAETLEEPKEKPKKKKRVAIKAVTLTSSWRIESDADIDKYLDALRKNLKAQLEDDTIVSIEF